MLNKNIKKITAISMLAFTIGISGASASTADLSNEAKAYGEKLAEKTYSPENNTEHSNPKKKSNPVSLGDTSSQKPIRFSREWLKSLSTEEMKKIDWSQVDFSEFCHSLMTKYEAESKGKQLNQNMVGGI